MADLFVMELPAVRPPAGSVPDAADRERALDIGQSWIVEAPAGSGKTGLLIQRFLKLLASDSVEDPREVLAITFTRKATSEMVERVWTQLAAARDGVEPKDAFDRTTRGLAQAVLERDAQFGWGLLERPQRLNIRTIDSVCMDIAASLPLLSGSGGGQAPDEDAETLHREAAHRTTMQLGGDDAALTQALKTVLLHRDGNLKNVEELIASMLACRDQWGELVPLARAELDDAHLDANVLPRLEKALDLAICRALTSLTHLLPEPLLERLCRFAAEMAHVEGYQGSVSPIAICQGKLLTPEAKADHLDHWRALLHLLVKRSPPRDWRKSTAVNLLGFKVDKGQKAELLEMIAALGETPGLLDELCGLDALPPATYPAEEWVVVKALFRVLSRALAELQIVFAERGRCDFAEVGLMARTALRVDGALEDLQASAGIRLQHLLVDEMQDTSTSQYELIHLLTQRWDGYGQTVFLVGDPKQSIYLFRQARVERFVQTMLAGRLGDLPLGRLQLTANFRSRPALVAAFNHDFALLFPPHTDPARPEMVPFRQAVAVRTGPGRLTWHTAVLPYSSDMAASTAMRRTQAMDDARQIRTILAEWRERPLPEKRVEPWKLAVLVRNRPHLLDIVSALKTEPAIPYRAVEIEPLAERQEILDLVALTRALLHPGDRTAWLALLRAPWCGLTLADLHRLAGADDRIWARRTLLDTISVRGDELSADGIARLEIFWKIMAAAQAQRGRLRLAQAVERTWAAFGAPAFASAEARANAERFLRLLDELEEDGGRLDLARLTRRLARLYATPSVHPGAVDLMTIHGAKGLEWDLVCVPALERTGQVSGSRLLSWLETDAPTDDVAPGILAPISSKGRKTADLNKWIRSVESGREAAERKRLFYVVATRAREELHLFASLAQKKDGSVKPKADSLLGAAWPAAEEHFVTATMPFAGNVVQMPPLEISQKLDSLAAAAERPVRMIERIPSEWIARLLAAAMPAATPASAPVFSRPEGSFAARALGNATHAFLDLLALRIADGENADALRAQVPAWTARVAAVLRATGLPPAEVERYAAAVVRALARTLDSADGRWLLAAHPAAVNESAVVAFGEDGQRTSIRLDRMFLAGSQPATAGTECLWIVDYKTSTHAAGGLDAFLREERTRYAPQLERYAREVNVDGRAVRLALFYPMLGRIDWWDPAKPGV